MRLCDHSGMQAFERCLIKNGKFDGFELLFNNHADILPPKVKFDGYLPRVVVLKNLVILLAL